MLNITMVHSNPNPALRVTHYALRASGMTLLEVVVSISIISIATALLLSALPLIRSQQQLKLAAAHLQSDLRRAQLGAINETRAPACIDEGGSDQAQKQHCSDIGITVQNNEVVEFADIDANGRYNEPTDFLLSKEPLPGAVSVPAKTWVFKASPPTINLYVNGTVQLVSQPDVTIINAGALKATLNTYAYGYVEAKF